MWEKFWGKAFIPLAKLRLIKMACIVCGDPAGYLCCIKELGVYLCAEHLESVSWDKALKLELT